MAIAAPDSAPGAGTVNVERGPTIRDARASTRRLWPRLAVAAVLLSSAAWFGRLPLAHTALRQMLAAKGIDAQFSVTEAGSDGLVLDDVRLGSHKAPDFVARRMTVDLDWSPWSALVPVVTSVRLDAPMLRLRIGPDGIGFGSLDRLIPAGRSTRFPAVALTIVGGSVDMTTPAGAVAGQVEASGRLDRDFRAVLQTLPAPLGSGDCRVEAGPAMMTLTTLATRFAARGSGSLVDLNCGGAVVPQVHWTGNFAAPLTLATLAGGARLLLSPASLGAVRSRAPLSVRLDGGGTRNRLGGTWRMDGGRLGTARDSIAVLKGDGRFDWASGGDGVGASGSVSAHGIMSQTLVAALGQKLPGVAAALAARMAAAARSVDGHADIAATIGRQISVRVLAADLTGGGARLGFVPTGDSGWSPGLATVDGAVHLGGGGLPDMRLDLDRLSWTPTAAQGHGRLVVAPWRGGGGRIAVPGLAFGLANGAIGLSGRVIVSSPVAGGRIDDLDLPFDAGYRAGRLTLGRGCTALSFRRAQFGTLALGTTAARVCPATAGPLLVVADGRLAADINLGGLRLRGTSNGRGFDVDLRPTRLAVAGTTDHPVLKTEALVLAGTVDGAEVGGRISGTLAAAADGWRGRGGVTGLSLRTPAIRASGGVGGWTASGGRFDLTDAAVHLVDPAAAPRFAPLHITGIEAALDGDRITGHATVRLAAGTPLAAIAGDYRLAEGDGRVRVDSTIVFQNKLQPLQISELARGLVADVAGTVVSHADLVVSPAGIAGAGSVRLDHVSLATAALGPVTDIDGRIDFDDIGRLHTPPGQMLTIAAINPGILVEDGVARFQLLGSDAVRIEAVRWPFTGGTLTVQPVTVRAGDTRRTFELAVDGLDAEQFLNRFQLSNLNVTGRFDGVLPLVFAGDVGRIEGGVLTARAGGGLLQYVGDVGQDSMGAAGRLAFDALRRLRYRSLSLTLDGDLDGELVTAINFAGINEVPVRAAGGLPIRATGLPFKFGVTVRAPFRALLGTAASFSDARSVIRATKAAPGVAAGPGK